MKLRRFMFQGKQNGYVDNYKSGEGDRYEIIRRPYSDHHIHHNHHNRYLPRPIDDGYERDLGGYNAANHWVKASNKHMKLCFNFFSS